MKLILIIIFFLPLLVLATNECPRFGIINEDIPCIQTSSWKPSGNCADYTATIFNITGGIQSTQTYYDYTPNCAFNITGLQDPGVYSWNSSLDSGYITLERKNNMLSITLIQIGLIVFFILVGLPYKFGFLKFLSWSLALIEIVVTVWMIYIVEAGGNITELLYINAISTLMIGGLLGIPALIMLMAKMSTWQGKKIADDGYTKFINND